MLNTPRWRVLLMGAATTLSLVLPYGVAHAAPDPDKISPAVQQQLDSADKATFWVRVKGGADLTAARRATTKEVKAEQVYEAKTEHAESSQAGLRKMLKPHDVDFTPYWIVNAVKVTGERQAGRRDRRAARGGADRAGPHPQRAQARSRARRRTKVNAIEWNIDRVNAPRVWDELGNRGEGIVVANIDTGVQFDHPDLQRQLPRPATRTAPSSHDYNWFDPAGICPTAAPCDNNGHGTHTMGTMVGAGPTASASRPGAQWIAAKGCESNSCSDASLLAAGQWILAPTDAERRQPAPRPRAGHRQQLLGRRRLRPLVQGDGRGVGRRRDLPGLLQRQRGPELHDQRIARPVRHQLQRRRFDINNALYARSSKGAGENGEIKPNIAAPGVNVRSSVPGGYASFTGTSMASPHVAATVALIWSASPSLNGDIEATRPLLDVTAIDVADTACGGTAADNNIWGEGRLDTFAAVQAAPQEELGELKGVVTAGGAPVAGVTVTVTGPTGRTVITGADGAYTFVRLLPGEYEIRAAKFGYATASATATVVAEQSATADVTLTPLASGVVSGTVTTAGTAEAGARILAGGTPLSAVTDAGGRYRLTLPYGDYELSVVPASRCSGGDTASVTVGGDLTKDFDLPLRGDNFGYTCAGGTEPYVAGTDKLALTGDDEAAQVTLPFAIPFYGANETRAWIATNGFASFAADRSTAAGNGTLPTAATPNHAVYPFWDDLVVDDQGGIYTGVVGTAPRRQYVIEWRNVRFFSDSTQRISFSALLGEDGSVSYRYKDIESERDQGAFATVGIENAGGHRRAAVLPERAGGLHRAEPHLHGEPARPGDGRGDRRQRRRAAAGRDGQDRRGGDLHHRGRRQVLRPGAGRGLRGGGRQGALRHLHQARHGRARDADRGRHGAGDRPGGRLGGRGDRGGADRRQQDPDAGADQPRLGHAVHREHGVGGLAQGRAGLRHPGQEPEDHAEDHRLQQRRDGGHGARRQAARSGRPAAASPSSRSR